MSTLSLRKIKHDSSAVDNIITNSDGGVGLGGIDPSTLPGFIDHAVKVQNGGGLGIQSANATDNRWIFFGHGTTSADVQRAGIVNQGSDQSLALATAGSQKLIVDTAGRVTTPYQPSFSVGFSTSYTQLSGVRDVQFNYKNFDVGTNFNTSTYRFTAPVAGKYLFSAFVGTNGGAPANSYFGIGFVVNGSSQGLCWYNSSSGYQKDAIIQLLNLSANDYVLVHMEVQNNTTLNTGNFSGYLVG